MEKMKQEVKDKLTYWGRLCALFAILMATYGWKALQPANAQLSSTENFADFFSGFQLGIVIVFLLYALKNIVTFRKNLQNEEALRSFYIKVHDERTAAIENKSGGRALYTCGVLIIGASIIAGYFDPVVFVTLLICGVFLLLVQKGLQIYYCKKM